MPILSEHFKGQIRKSGELKDVFGVGGSFSSFDTDDLHSLREWWYTLLQNYGKYPCCAIFLVLSSDKEAVQYMRESRTELNAISGSSCLVILLGNNFFFTSGLENEISRPDDFMVSAINLYIESGESLQVAELFGIEITQFPCLVFFRDIRSAKIAVVSLKDNADEKINQRLREVFSVIRKQVKEDPELVVEAIQKYSAGQKAIKKKKQIAQYTGAFIEKTIESIMDAWVKSAIK